MNRRSILKTITGALATTTAITSSISATASNNIDSIYIANLAGLDAEIQVGKLQQAHMDYEDGKINDATFARVKGLWRNDERQNADFETSHGVTRNTVEAGVAHVGDEPAHVNVIKDTDTGYQEFETILEPGDTEIATGKNDAYIAVEGDDFVWADHSVHADRWS